MPTARTSLRVLLSTASAWTALAGVAAAQSAPRADQVDDIIVTAAPYGVSQRASVIATDVVDEQALAVAPAQSLGDLLSSQPGLRSTSFAPGASRPVIRGLSGPRVQVLSNGIGLIDASSVSPDHAVATDPAEASRIEVVRGPSTLIYGGSAIGGVVNIIDGRVPSEQPEGGVDGVISTQASSVDDGRSIFGRLTFGAGPFVFNVDGVDRRTDDYSIPSPSLSARKAALDGVARDDNDTQPNSATELQAWGAGGSYVGTKGFIGASYKETDSQYGTVAEPDVFIQLNQTREDVRGEYRFDAGPFSALRGNYGHAEYTHTEFEGPGEPGTIFNSDGQEGRIDLVQRERPVGETGAWNGGIGVQALSRDFSAIGDEAYVPSTHIEEQGIYAIQRYDRGATGFEGGLRFDRRTLTATPLGTTTEIEREYDNVSASIAAFARPAPGLFVALSLARNERAPSEVELFADGLHIATAAYETGDPTLDTEKVTTLEGTIHYAKGAFEGDLHVYGSRYDGFIDERPTGAIFSDGGEDFPVFQFIQTDAEFYGFEAEGSYAVWSSGDRTVSLEGQVDYVHADTDLGPAARIPPYSVTGRVAYASTAFDAGLEVRHVGEQDELAAFEIGTDSYTLVNLTGAWRPLADRNVTVFAEARNLTDEEAREHVSFLKDIAPMPGRNLRVGVAYRF
ncbi:TonB-dependent receptor [Brevundimonas subvibrioides]|uniref:TonB-dependent receptor n=1 Tax=Brevundimonas subvibrioides (strain ATCC 15264 / DSM 4735 / LMG 14903 / NBRC 16000 / CB 81) TaxID=633149 RepID=D9QIG8_BRESC|nr:TonB-dependent receptor [Brevundimonas subvibrioides]ADK99470.1 TonB-dependent receptor [Brevundimonas subvibrioides ATCC 15264]